MKKVFQLLTVLAFLMPGFMAYGQVSDYCGIMKVSVQNVTEVQNGLEFDVFVRSAKKSTEQCGDLFMGHTDIWIKLAGGDFTNAKIEKLGNCTFSPAEIANPYSAMMVQQSYLNGTSVKILDSRAVININSPAAYDQNTINSNLAYLDTRPREHKLGTFRITDYQSTQSPILSVQNMDKGASVELNNSGYDRFCSKSHTNALSNNGVMSYAVKVIPDEFLREQIEKFDAKRANKKSANIDWEIEKGESIVKYILERSVNGTDWTPIQELDGGQDRYNYLDEDVYDGKAVQETFHYRVKMESNDDYDYTEVKSVTFSNVFMTSDFDQVHEGLSVYPNPATDGVFVDMSGMESSSEVNRIQIMDINGKLVIDHNVLPNSTKEYIRFGGKKEMATGMYLVQLMSGSTLVGQQKIEVQ